jgi:hypothetical protein
LPLTAQEPLDTHAGPITRTITREAVRLTEESVVVDGDDEAAPSTSTDWPRVRRLKPGTAVIVTTRRLPGRQRYVISAAESGMTVLNVADPTLPGAARRMLIDIAANHPEYFEDALNGGTVLIRDTNVRLARDGVFAGNRRIGSLEQLAETIARRDIVEIALPGRERSELGITVLTFAGIFIGLTSATAVAYCAPRCSGLPFYMLSIGVPVGGYFAFRGTTPEVVYRAG